MINDYTDAEKERADSASMKTYAKLLTTPIFYTSYSLSRKDFLLR